MFEGLFFITVTLPPPLLIYVCCPADLLLPLPTFTQPIFYATGRREKRGHCRHRADFRSCGPGVVGGLGGCDRGEEEDHQGSCCPPTRLNCPSLLYSYPCSVSAYGLFDKMEARFMKFTGGGGGGVVVVLFAVFQPQDPVMAKDKTSMSTKPKKVKTDKKEKKEKRKEKVVVEEEVTPMDVPADDDTTEEEVREDHHG